MEILYFSANSSSGPNTITIQRPNITISVFHICYTHFLFLQHFQRNYLTLIWVFIIILVSAVQKTQSYRAGGFLHFTQLYYFST